MKRFLFCSYICLLCFSCHPEKDRSSSAKLTSFKGLPPQLVGCSCYFSASEKEFNREHYIFASDLDSVAYVSISRKLITLKLIGTTREPNIMDERDYQNTYTDGIYTVVVTIHFKEHTGDEAWWNTGEISLFFKNVAVDKKIFSGECGC